MTQVKACCVGVSAVRIAIFGETLDQADPVDRPEIFQRLILRIVVDNYDLVRIPGELADTAQTQSDKIECLVVYDAYGCFTFDEIWL